MHRTQVQRAHSDVAVEFTDVHAALVDANATLKLSNDALDVQVATLYLGRFDGQDRVIKKSPILWLPDPSAILRFRCVASEIRRQGATLHWMWMMARTAERQIARELSSTPRALAGNQRTLARIARQLVGLTADLAFLKARPALGNRRVVATRARIEGALEAKTRKATGELSTSELRRRELLTLRERAPDVLLGLRGLTMDCELAGKWTDVPLDVALKISILLEPTSRIALARTARQHRAVMRAAHLRGLFEAYPDGLVPFVFTYAHLMRDIVPWRAFGLGCSDHVRALTRLWFGSSGSHRRLSGATLAHFRSLDAPVPGSASEWRDEHGCMNRLCDPSASDDPSAPLTRRLLADPFLSALTLTSGTRRCYRMFPRLASPTHLDVVEAINRYPEMYGGERAADASQASSDELE